MTQSVETWLAFHISMDNVQVVAWGLYKLLNVQTVSQTFLPFIAVEDQPLFVSGHSC